jgi:quercetin dioxygenase-like cupin family protein
MEKAMSETQVLAANIVVALALLHTSVWGQSSPRSYEKGSVAEVLSPTPLHEANTTILGKNGAPQAVHISVQSWAITGQERGIPVEGFYVAHLLSGQILATIDGEPVQHLPGDYWTVKAGAAMRVKVVGEVAVLETTVVSKQ